jgi:hypothetical protein
MNITALPNDIFLLIIAYLSPKELILCRRVSKQFHAAFTQPDLSRQVLVSHYPRARELRITDQNASVDWSGVFSKVAGRYYHLKSGIPRSIEKLPMGRSSAALQWTRHYPVAPWWVLQSTSQNPFIPNLSRDRHLSFLEKTTAFHYPDPLWTYDDGLLIFPSADLQRYALYDLEAGSISEVNFEPEEKIVRRIRLFERVLVVEWCEHEAYHQLNENEMVYRHFATAYDIMKDKELSWKVNMR